MTETVELSGKAARNLRREERMTALIRECEGAAMRDWQRLAACRYSDPDLFDLEDADSGVPSGQVHAINLARHEEAVRYCRRCPVRLACLADALEQDTKGTRGGELLTVKDHEAARRVRRRIWEQSL